MEEERVLAGDPPPASLVRGSLLSAVFLPHPTEMALG
jgi:hypothetical protein